MTSLLIEMSMGGPGCVVTGCSNGPKQGAQPLMGDEGLYLPKW